jgi:hypothetical protein
MFEKNAPKECLDAGISSSNADAPRKCAKIMFMQRAPKECIDAGITGEGRDDESKCRQLVGEGNNGAGQKPMSEGGPTTSNQPKFNRDCNKIQDSNEKMKCYEEFYNNAQVQFKEDFVQREMTDSRTGEVITPEEENARQQCRSKGMDTILEYKNGKRIILCVDKNQAGGSSGRCQSQNQIENLKQDCKSRGQDANVENRGGCPWVICMGGETERTYAPGTGPSQQTQNRIEQSSGIKCPDGVCDDYEKMNPWACPEDCGGQRTQPPQPQNRIDQPTQPSQQQFCSGQAPSCAPNGAPYCQNGNWVCPQPQQEQQPIQPQPPQQPVQNPPAQPEPQPTPTTTPEPTPAPVTGGVTGRIITSVYGDEATRNGDAFLDYWFNR